MTEFDVIVPHKTMTPERADECNQVMITGNKAFRRWLPFISQRRSKSCRAAVIKGRLNEVLQYIPSERRVEFIQDVPAILAVEKVIPDVTGHYVKMVVRLARRWAALNHSEKSSKRSYIDGGDIASEGFLAMFDAIHNYDRDSIRFLTYAWTTVNRRMFAALMETAPISCFSRREQKLLQKVVKDQLQAGRKKSLSEAVRDGVLTGEDAEVVREMLTVKVVLASTLETSFGDHEDMFDFTSLRQGVMTDTRDQPNDAWELYDFIERAGLSDFEQDALLSSMTPFRGWQVECAGRHTHPTSGEPLSRMSVGIALQRACNKIRKVAGLEDSKINLSALMTEAMSEE
jgi:DNA-directed RNA polymerase specialized sigma subunit